MMSMTVLNSHEEKDMNMGSHIDSDAVEAVGGGGSSVDVQAIVVPRKHQRSKKFPLSPQQQRQQPSPFQQLPPPRNFQPPQHTEGDNFFYASDLHGHGVEYPGGKSAADAVSGDVRARL